ncbi:hypothetical protein PQ455_05760 [Sphingomonas naphthae]|uniref:Uncharacterized protein n=1 Tax=Sphingomonas naphthae TaxID=1813468 RepID=A0ABY7TNB6_9SPHN|nr:hypothetical protein [Sphingomonas naphthae]WCT74732.1 hypothetical protein PQ455_05760 [Sphingomonas naphthae]
MLVATLALLLQSVATPQAAPPAPEEAREQALPPGTAGPPRPPKRTQTPVQQAIARYRERNVRTAAAENCPQSKRGDIVVCGRPGRSEYEMPLPDEDREDYHPLNEARSVRGVGDSPARGPQAVPK